MLTHLNEFFKQKQKPANKQLSEGYNSPYKQTNKQMG